ncbi:hypothetical protein JHK82_025935 [Glycine max]|nr:hypothetical protein JHK86_026062 [Glycine max]KAG5134747.1 hypothetical protein JHK82_025935 [Glycine max]KAH1044360.1 hypothetical protein GYH30_025904 [Glycine max]KAH1234720.1 hypothetical protein GmHk_09G026849 [Glycine max]
MGMETVWNSQSNWTIASGSIRDCITFQSSLSLLHDDDDSESTPTPLLLHPPSPDSTPCEIKITFAEKHELRQIYVRSTARVYEIYYAPNSRTNNDYLSTVRCGIAVRDDQVLRSPSIQNLSDDNVNKTEDDWVEVKVPDSPSQTKPYPNSTKTSLSQSQDLYEATAEINDANPCISVTLRLLSLQNKGRVYVDEIYVFADPVDSVDSESQENHNENSSSSSLMAMFLPLMQLSKTTGLSNLNSLRKEKLHVSEDDLEVTLPSDSVIKTQLKGNTSITDPQEVKLNEVKGGWVGPSQPDALSQDARIESNHAAVSSQTAKMDSTCSVVPSKIAEMENNHSAVPFQFAKTECNCSAVPSQGSIPESNHGDYLGGKVERALEQLVSRMDRIEEICLGFQEKMVMPMSSMEARLQRVELQLDTLTKKLQTSALPSCSRISAPDASCIESDANSFEDCPDYTVTRENESDEKHLHTEVPYDSALMSDSENATQLLPGLVVTAPEFPDGEDEDGDASGQEINSSKDKGKQSIDDALSSALASFLSSLSLDSPKYTKSLSVKAPEFSNEDDDDNESNNSEIAKNYQVHLTDSEEFSLIQVLASSNTWENSEKINPDSNDKHSKKIAQEAEENDQLCSAEGDQDEVCVKTGLIDSFEEDKNGKVNCQKSDISDELVDNQTPFGHSITKEGPSSGTELTVAAEVPRKTFHENIIENVLGFALASSVVDFENPILDVKFISQRSPATERFLEDLLVGTQDQETSSRDQPVKESNDDVNVKEQLKSNGDVSVEEQSNLISIEDGELVIPASDSHFAVDKDLCASSIIAPVNNEDDNLPLPEDHKRKRDQ